MRPSTPPHAQDPGLLEALEDARRDPSAVLCILQLLPDSWNTESHAGDGG